MNMFDISIIVYKFLDTSVYCVGRETDLNLLQQYFELHRDQINGRCFTERIVNSKIYARFKAKKPCAFPLAWRSNRQLAQNGLLLNMNYLDEAMFLANTEKMIAALKINDYHGLQFQISDYWTSRFPEFPGEFMIREKED